MLILIVKALLNDNAILFYLLIQCMTAARNTPLTSTLQLVYGQWPHSKT